jgi:MerR family transcriptional regulator, light-induced transcriptional regulator
MPATGRQLDLQSAADELGVHYQTAYRWVRTGRLDAHLIDGRYLVDEQVLTDLIEHRAKPSPPTRPSPKRLEGTRDKMLDALISGDETEARRLARSLVDEGASVTDLIQQILVPPLRQIGTDWHEGKLSIWVEHRASSITERILGDVSPNPRGRRRGTVMVAAVAGDLHSLATSMAAAALREDNWNVHHLGADVPTDQLVDFCSSQELDLAVLTMTNPDCAVTAEAAMIAIERTGTAVIVGAPGRSLDDLLIQARGAIPSPSEFSERLRAVVDLITD